jgi:hypothetical protein
MPNQESRGPTREAADPETRFRWQPWFAWIVAIAVVLFWGFGLVGVDFNGLSIVPPPRVVALSSEPPATIHTPQLALEGVTKPLALISTFVDGSRLPFATAGDEGDFQLTVDIGGLGVHTIRIEIAYGQPDHPDELREFSVTRVPDVLPTPEVIAVEQLTDPTSFVVLVRATPLTTIVATGATLDPAASRLDSAGRSELKVQLDPSGGPVTLVARDDQGGSSAPTPSLDLATLAAQPAASAQAGASQPTAFDQADWKVSYLITRDGVTRTQTVVVDKHRREVIDLTRGAIDAGTFIRVVGGPAGVAPSRSFGCLVTGLRPPTSELEIGDQARLTITDDFPDLLTSWNGLTDRPRVSLCFPTGFPGLGNTGTIELKVRDYSIASVTGEVETASPSPLPAGDVERTDTWTSVPRNGAIDVALTLDTPSVLASLPTVRPRNVISEEGLGALLLGFIDAVIHGAGVLLLLWAICTRTAREMLKRPDVHKALADVLTLGAAILFLPVFGQLQEVGLGIANVKGLLVLSADIKVDPNILGPWVVAGILVLVTLGAARWVWNRIEFLARAFLALAIGAGGWLGISVASVVVPLLMGGGGDTILGIRIATWLIGAIGLTVILTVLIRSFGVFLEKDSVSFGKGGPARAGWAALAALLLAIPAGTDQSDLTLLRDRTSYIDGTVTGLAGLIAFVYALVAITAVAYTVRSAWKSTPWEKSLPSAASDPGKVVRTSPGWSSGDTPVIGDWLAPQIGRALFAGFVIGTAGVLLPIPFVLAFFFFGFLLRSAGDIARLATEAPLLRRRRKMMIEAALGDPSAAFRLGNLSPKPTVSYAELAPEPSVWDNTRLALQVAVALLVPLLLVYVVRYPFGTMTQQDEYFLQRFVINVATFSGTWLTIALVFAMLYEYLRGTTGVRKGLWLGLAILLFTVPWQLLSGLATTLSPVAIGIHVIEVLTLTGLIGAVFDLRLLQQGAHVEFGHPRKLLQNVGVVAGLPDLAAAIGLLIAALATTAVSLLTGQVTQLLSRVLTPFLPLGPGGGQ